MVAKLLLVVSYTHLVSWLSVASHGCQAHRFTMVQINIGIKLRKWCSIYLQILQKVLTASFMLLLYLFVSEELESSILSFSTICSSSDALSCCTMFFFSFFTVFCFSFFDFFGLGSLTFSDFLLQLLLKESLACFILRLLKRIWYCNASQYIPWLLYVRKKSTWA